MDITLYAHNIGKTNFCDVDYIDETDFYKFSCKGEVRSLAPVRTVHAS